LLLFQVQLGEELLAQGDLVNGVEHLSLAVAVCGQPHALLSVLQQTLPPNIFQLLLQNLDIAQEKVKTHMTGNSSRFEEVVSLSEEDLE
jgi:import receptor subunit TOM20